MSKSITVHQKTRGRPATGRYPTITARLPETTISSVDKWATKNYTTRSEAIRRLVEMALVLTHGKPRKLSKKAISLSSALAAEEIDRLQHGHAATPDQQASRKRRLLKGPTEFRDMRAPKAKG